MPPDAGNRTDISALLQIEEEDTCENFSQGSKDIEPLIQSTAKRPDKVFTVNVVNSGDTLVIYTDEDGQDTIVLYPHQDMTAA